MRITWGDLADSAGNKLIDGAKWIHDRRGYIKGGLLMAAVGAVGQQANAEEQTSYYRWIIEHPALLMAGGAAIGGIWGLAYSIDNIKDAYMDERKALAGEKGEAYKGMQEADAYLKEMEIKNRVAQQLGIKDLSEIPADNQYMKMRAQSLLNKARLDAGVFSNGKAPQEITGRQALTYVANIIFNEAKEGLSAATKTALLLLFFDSTIRVMLAEGQELFQDGHKLSEVAGLMADRIGDFAWVFIFAGASLIDDIYRSIQKESTKLIPQQ